MTAPEVQTPGGSRAQSTNQETSNPIFADITGERKEFATLAARLALAGYTLSELTDSTLLICRWDRSIHCSDLAQIRAFYRRIGGAA